MQISARYKAVEELVAKIFEDKWPADSILNAYFRERRFIGAKDRRFISEEVWNIIRNRRRLEFDAKSKDIRKIMLVYLRDGNWEEIFSGGQYGMAFLSDEEQNWLQNLEDVPYPPDVEAECPLWIYDKIGNITLLKSLNTAASADFRVNGTTRDKVLLQMHNEGYQVENTSFSPLGLRSGSRINLNNCMAFHDGFIEPQDEASQLAAILTDALPQHKIIDYCCGAGGKSLAIADLLKNQGKIEAHDIDFSRMDALNDRMHRLRITNVVKISSEQVDKNYDRFIIDAPCSGSGIWRRSPDAKFRLTPKRLTELTKIQHDILDIAADRVKIGGRIIYITCSVLAEENHAQIEAFLKRHNNFEVLNIRDIWSQKIGDFYPFDNDKFLQFSPLATDTDGFFFTALQRKS